MHQHTLAPLLGLFNEFKNLLGGFVSSVKEHLRLLVHPEESQVDYAHVLPEIAHLLASAVDDVRNFVSDYKF